MKRIFLITVFLTSLVVLSACLRRGASSEEASGETPGPATLIPTLLATKEEDSQPEDMDAVETEEPLEEESGFEVVPTEVRAVVTVPDEVTLYSGPGDNYPPVRNVFGGLTWPVTWTSPDGLWWKLDCSDALGEDIPECWLSADPSISTSVDSSQGGVTVLATSVDSVRVLASLGLNLRDGPGLDSKIITLLNLDETLRVTGISEDGEWWRVLCTDGTLGDCWVSTDPTLTEPGSYNQISLAGLVYGEVNGLQRWMVNEDGEASLLVDAESLQAVRGPISPDGRYLVRGGARGDTNLHLDDLISGESQQLTDTPDRFNFNPVWWPENPGAIVFMSRELTDTSQPGQPGPANLAMVKTDGSGFQVLDEEHISHTMQPSLSPDGVSIAYDHGGETASEDGILTPWIYTLDGGAEIFDYAAYGFEAFPGLSFGAPAWSPDGRYLSWVVGGDLAGDGEWGIALANFDLQEKTVQILNPYKPGSCLFVWCFSAPAWSPDSEWLAWEGFPSGTLPGFWLMRPDGADAVFITDGGAPFWSPDSSALAFNKSNAIQVMESGVWQQQPSGLPTGNMVMDWLDPTLSVDTGGTSNEQSTTLACNSVGPGSAQYLACNVRDSLLSRNLAALESYMGTPFTLGYWASEGISDTPRAIIEQIKGLYNYDAPDYTPRLTFTTDREQFPPLEGTPPERMFGPDVNVVLVLYSEGWGPEGEGAALFMIAEDESGRYYLPGMVYSGEHFDK